MDSWASDLMLKTGSRRSEGERVHLPEKYTSSNNSSDHIVFGEEKKKSLPCLQDMGKILFLPLVQCCCSSSWSGLWAVFLHRTEMKARSQSTGPECDLADISFTCSGGHFVGYLLAALVQKER